MIPWSQQSMGPVSNNIYYLIDLLIESLPTYFRPFAT